MRDFIKNENSYSENQQLLRDLIDNSPFGQAVLDFTTLEIKIVNKTFALQLGLNPDRLKGKTIHDILDERNVNLITTLKNKLIGENEITSNDSLTLDLNDKFLFSLKNINHVNKRNLILRTWRACRHISHGSSYYSKSEYEMYRKAENIAKFGYWSLNVNTGKVSTSQGARLIYGLSDGPHTITEIQKQPLPEYRKMLDESLENLIKLNRKYDVEFQIKRPTDNKIIDLHSVADYDQNNGIVIGVLNDITERKSIERQLRRSEYHYRVIAENMHDVIWRLDKSGNINYVSPSVEKLLAYKPEEIVGKNFREITKRNDNTEVAQNAFKQVLQRSEDVKSNTEPVKVIIDLPVKNGNTIWVEVFASAVLDKKGKFQFVLAVSRDITDRINTEKALKNTEAKLLAAVDSTGLAIWEHNYKNQVVSRNENWYSMLGYKPDDIPNRQKSWLELIHNDDLAKVKNSINEFEAGDHEFFAIEHRMKTKTGQWKWIYNWGKIIERAQNGKPLKAMGVHIDITDKKQAELALVESESRYRRLVENSPDCILIQRDGKIEFINESGVKILGGKNKEQFTGLPVTRFMDPATVKRVRERNHKLYNHIKDAYPVEETIYRMDGTKIRIEVHGSLIEYQGQKSILVIIRDLTERMKTQTALRESEARYRTIAESFPNGVIFIVDRNYRYTFAAGQGLSLMGLQKDNIIGRPYRDIFPDNVAALIRKNILHTNDGNQVTFEMNFLGHDFSNQVVPIFNEYNEIEQYVIISTDISDRKKAESLENDLFNQLENEVEKRVAELNEQTAKLKSSQKALTYLLEDVNEAREELQQANENLEAANNDLEAFAYSVSHDLRAPIRHIDGFAQLLEKNLKKNPEVAEAHLGKIHSAASRMHNLIDDLLSFSRLGRIKKKSVKVDLNSMIKDLIGNYEPDIKNRKIKWEIEELPVVSGDPELLKIAFDNLISNAIKFTSKKVKAVISIKVHQIDQKTVQIMIEDNGVGFDMQYVNKIFGVFERLHSLDDFSGTGIGLANVKRVLQSHNGSIEAYGEIDRGAKFIITLPLGISG